METGQTTGKSDYLPPKLRSSYSELTLISEASFYYLYEGKSKYSHPSCHTIRALNFNSKFVKDNHDVAASLFIKELLRLVSIDPTNILINSFEISDGGQKMAFASLSYAPLSTEIPHEESSKVEEETKENYVVNPSGFANIQCVTDMISDVVSDIDFLSNELKIKDCSALLTPQNIYRFKESGTFLLGDWSPSAMNHNQVAQGTGTNIRRPASLPMTFKEIFSFGLSVLELNGVEPEQIGKLREMEAKKDLMLDITLKELLSGKELGGISKELKELLKRMLSTDVYIRRTIDEFIDNTRRRRNGVDDGMDMKFEGYTFTPEELDFLVRKVMNLWVPLRTLNLKGTKFSSKAITALGKNNTWTNLKSLNLSSTNIGPEGGAPLGQNNAWTNLEILDLSCNNFGDQGVTALSKNNSWTKLVSLNLSNNNVGSEGAKALSKNSSWKNLTLLNLYNNRIEAEGATALGENQSWTNLKTLDISWNKIGSNGAEGLSKNDSWKHLETLSLHNNKIGPEGVAALSENNIWKCLKTLNLHNNKIGPEGAKALSKNESWKNLTTLNLHNAKLGPEGAVALSENCSWENLTALILYNNQIDAEGAVALSKNGSWNKLEILNLYNNNVGDQGAAALSKNESWKNLLVLNLSANSIGAEGAVALSKNGSWANLIELNLQYNEIGVEGEVALKQRWPEIELNNNYKVARNH